MVQMPLARHVILRVAHAPGMPGTFSPPSRVSDLDMHHGGGENVPGIPDACATGNFTYLARGPWLAACSASSHHRRQFWLIVIGPVEDSFSEIWIEIQIFCINTESTLKNSVWNMLTRLSWPQCITWTRMSDFTRNFTWNQWWLKNIKEILSLSTASTASTDGLVPPIAKPSADIIVINFYCCFRTGSVSWIHHSDVIMSAMASQITGIAITYKTVCSGTYQRKHQSSASLDFVRGIHRWPMNSPHNGPVKRKMFPFDDFIMHIDKSCMEQEIDGGLRNDIHIQLTSNVDPMPAGITAQWRKVSTLTYSKSQYQVYYLASCLLTQVKKSENQFPSSLNSTKIYALDHRFTNVK